MVSRESSSSLLKVVHKMVSQGLRRVSAVAYSVLLQNQSVVLRVSSNVQYKARSTHLAQLQTQ